jgi:hypothetical protein
MGADSEFLGRELSSEKNIRSREIKKYAEQTA